MTTDLLELRFLDEAARAAGCKGGWEEVKSWGQCDFNAKAGFSIIAHSRSLQKLAELEAENAWRPIEEARKDGTVVDVWVGGEFPGRLANVSWREPTDSEWWVHGGDTIDAPDATWHDGFGPLGKDSQPTHFRPLPSPPEGPDA